ncbi:DUF6387 family protein [Undibacterium aquatile]
MLQDIKRLDDLPKEFSLKKYEGACRLDLKGWAAALNNRFDYWVSQKYLKSDYDKSKAKKCSDEGCRHCNDNIQYHEFEALKKRWLKQMESPLSIDINAAINEDSICSVRDMTLMDFGYQSSFFAKPSRSKYLCLVNAVLSDDDLEENSFFERCLMERENQTLLGTSIRDLYKEEGIIFGTDFFVSVDIASTDEKLMSDFQAWLKSKRTIENLPAKKKKFTDKDFNEWTEKAILPYLDLTIWALFNDLNITQALMGECLFPECDVNDAERIRKTVAPKAKEMMTESFVYSLFAQIRTGQAE